MEFYLTRWRRGKPFVRFELLRKDSEDNLREPWVSSRAVAISEVGFKEAQIKKVLVTSKR